MRMCGRPRAPDSGSLNAGDQRRYPVVAVACLQFGQAPVCTRDDVAAQRRFARATHGEVVGAAAGRVVAGDLLAGRNVPPCCQGVRVGPPQVRIAAVVAVVAGLAGRQDQVEVNVDGDGVDVRVTGLLRGLAKTWRSSLPVTSLPPRRDMTVPAAMSARANNPRSAIADGRISMSGCNQHWASGCGGALPGVMKPCSPRSGDQRAAAAAAGLIRVPSARAAMGVATALGRDLADDRTGC